MKKVFIVLVVFVGLFLMISCGSDSSVNDTSDKDQISDNEITDDAEAVDETEENVDNETTDEEQAYQPEITDRVLVKTSMGDITIGLYGEDTPDTVANFKQYVTDKFYDGLIFHRVIPDFVAQGGGYDKDLIQRETRKSIKFEASPEIKHVEYVLSMARSSSPNTATSQFFIMLGNAPHLDYESEDDFFDEEKFPCTAFGEVTAGFDVVDAIGVVETGTSGMFEDVPVESIIIESAVLIN